MFSKLVLARLFYKKFFLCARFEVIGPSTQGDTHYIEWTGFMPFGGIGKGFNIVIQFYYSRTRPQPCQVSFPLSSLRQIKKPGHSGSGFIL